MKTNQILKSDSRDLFGVKVRQESKTGHLNLSDLQSAYNQCRIENGWGEKTIDDVLRGKNNIERIFYLLDKQGFIKHGFPSFTNSIKPQIYGFTELVDKKGLTSVLKSLSVYRTTGRGSSRTTWCNPYIWVLVAMEMNPMLYAETVIWLTDGLIVFRNLAGDNYKLMSQAVAEKIGNEPDDFRIEAKMINEVVTGSKKTDRNTLSESELDIMSRCEKINATFIQNGIDYPERKKKLIDFVYTLRMSA